MYYNFVTCYIEQTLDVDWDGDIDVDMVNMDVDMVDINLGQITWLKKIMQKVRHLFRYWFTTLA